MIQCYLKFFKNKKNNPTNGLVLGVVFLENTPLETLLEGLLDALGTIYIPAPIPRTVLSLDYAGTEPLFQQKLYNFFHIYIFICRKEFSDVLFAGK